MGDRERLVTTDRGMGSSVLARHFDERHLIRELVGNAGGVLVDVGAATGMYSAYFGRRGWSAVAFEPEPENFRSLKQNTGRLEHVVCIPKAVGDEVGTVTLFVSEKHPGIHSLQPFDDSHTVETTVEMTTLGAVLQKYGVDRVTLLKIDAEGAELLVLRGLDWSEIRPRVVLAEFMDERSNEHFGYRSEDLVTFMESKGYRTFVSEWESFDSYQTREERESPHRWVGLSEPPAHRGAAWGNLLFLRDEDDLVAVRDPALRRRLVGRAMLSLASKSAARLPGATALARFVRCLGDRVSVRGELSSPETG